MFSRTATAIKLWGAAFVLLASGLAFVLSTSNPAFAADVVATKTVTRSVASKSLNNSKTLNLQSIAPQLDLSNEPDPSDVLTRAVREYSAGNLPKAERLFEKVIYLDPGNADAHYNLGAIKEWRNDWVGALGEYRIAQKSKPDDPEVAAAVHAVEFKIKNKPAIDAQLQKQRSDSELALHTKLAKETFEKQNYEEAVLHLSFLARINPQDAKVQYALGQSFRALHKYGWAAYRLKMAIFLDADNDLYRKTLVELDQEVQKTAAVAFDEHR